MKTAMQLMLWYLENEGLEESGVYYKAKMLLEKEKEQMIDFGYKCRNKCKKESKLLPQDIFNTTYNQKQ